MTATGLLVALSTAIRDKLWSFTRLSAIASASGTEEGPYNTCKDLPNIFFLKFIDFQFSKYQTDLTPGAEFISYHGSFKEV